MLIYDHNALAAPELLVPGRKPVGPVTYNSNYQQSTFLFRRLLDHGIGAPVRITQNDGTQRVDGIYSDNSGYAAYVSDAGGGTYWHQPVPVTLVAKFTIDSWGANFSGLCETNYNNTTKNYCGIRLFIATDGKITCRYGDGTGGGSSDRRDYGSNTGIITTGVVYTLVIVCLSPISTAPLLWINGAKHTMSHSSGTASSVGFNTGGTVNIGHSPNWNYGTPAPRGLNGTMHSICLLPGNYSGAAQSLSLNPYRILQAL